MFGGEASDKKGQGYFREESGASGHDQAVAGTGELPNTRRTYQSPGYAFQGRAEGSHPESTER